MVLGDVEDEVMVWEASEHTAMVDGTVQNLVSLIFNALISMGKQPDLQPR